MMRTICRLVVSCTLFLLPARVQGTVLVPASMAELARDAGAIVRGRVVAAEARFTPDRGAIETLVTVDAERTLKGSLGTTVQFLVPGGTLGRYRSIFVGAPELVVGQRVVVFLGWHGPSYPYLLGFGQGVFRVQADGQRGWLVTPPPIPVPATGTSTVVRGDPDRRPMPLADFEQRVRDLVTGTR